MARVDLPTPTLLDILACLVVFIVTVGPYLNSLEGNFCYDDKVAVGGNPDVVMPNVTLYDIATHDFWGNDILRRRPGGWTHDSWRPIVTLSFRANHKLGGLNTYVYHVTNVVIHSLVAVMAYGLAWVLLRRPLRPFQEERDDDPYGLSPSARGLTLHATAVALLFGLHPVHSECVANITSRADPMAAFFCLASAIVYLWGRSPEGFFEPVAKAWRRGARRARRSLAALPAATTFTSAASSPPLATSESQRQASGGDSGGGGGRGLSLLPPTSSSSSSHQARFKRRRKGASCCLTLCSWVGQGLMHSGQWLGAFLLVVAGIMCKETSLTMPLLLVLCDLGMALPAVSRLARLSLHMAAGGQQHQAQVQQRTLSQYALRTAQWLHHLTAAGFSALPLLRSLVSLGAGALIYYVRIVKMSKGYSLQSFANEMHNPLANIKDALTRRVGKAFVQSWAMTKMVLPIWLSHEHNAHQPVLTFKDPRNLLTLAVLAILAAILSWAFTTVLGYGWLSASPFRSGGGVAAAADGGGGGALTQGSSASSREGGGDEEGYDGGSDSSSSGSKGGSGSSSSSSSSSESSIEGGSHRNRESGSSSSSSSGGGGGGTGFISSISSRGGTVIMGNNSSPNHSSSLAKGGGAGGGGGGSTSRSNSNGRGVRFDERPHPPSRGGGRGGGGGGGGGGVDPPHSHPLHLTRNPPPLEEEGEGELDDLLVAVRTLTYLGWVIAAYAPSSHAFLYVAFVLAERTLFMPSFGAAMLIADGLRAVGSGRVWRGGGYLPQHFHCCPWARPSKGSKGARQQVQQQQQQQQRSPPRPLLALGAFLALALYYGVRIWVRNGDWATEEALLRSNLRIYPEHNGMTQYGMGAIKLYQQKFPEAEELLKRALVETTLAEPHILLSQLYWKHYNNYSSAITQLEAIEHTTSPRKEVMQNLGLLLMATGAAPPTNVSQRTRAEYLILLGHAAHGYPMGHPNIGLLASNAACVRVVSEPTRFASPTLAETLFKEALTFRHSSRVTAFKNNALFYAAMGQSAQAYRVAEEAIAYIEELRDRADQPEEGKKQANDFINNFRILQLSLDVHAPQVEAWLEQGLVAGQAAEDRFAFIGGDCSMELVYW